MTYRLMNREPEMRRMKNQIPHTGLCRRCGQFGCGFFPPAQDVLLHLETDNIFPARTTRWNACAASLKIAIVRRHGSDIDIRADAQKGLLYHGTLSSAEQPAFADGIKARCHKPDAFDAQRLF